VIIISLMTFSIRLQVDHLILCGISNNEDAFCEALRSINKGRTSS
jgi:hypothetical protein